VLSGFGWQVRATDFGASVLRCLGREVRATDFGASVLCCLRGQSCGDQGGGAELDRGHGIFSVKN